MNVHKALSYELFSELISWYVDKLQWICILSVDTIDIQCLWLDSHLVVLGQTVGWLERNKCFVYIY